jgi:predicted porin
MSKSKLLAALFLAVGLSTTALAQSTVNIYGVLDASVQNNKTTGGTNNYATSSQLRSNGSLFGLRGTENAGGGTNVFYQLETGVNTLGNERGNTSANNGTAFGTLRDSYVGISNDTVGTLKAGYFSTAFRTALVSMEIFPGAGIDLTPSTRATGISYDLPKNKFGVVGSVVYSGDNTPTVASAVAGTNRIVSGNLGLYAKDFGVISAMQQTNFVGTVYPVKQATNYSLGGQYTGIPKVRLSAIYGLNQYNTVRGEAGHNNVLWLGSAYRTGPHEARLSWAGTNDIKGITGAENSKVSQLTAGYAYHLSKRTQLYGVYTRANTGSDNAYNFTNSPVASITTMYALGNATYMQAVGAGIRHSF